MQSTIVANNIRRTAAGLALIGTLTAGLIAIIEALTATPIARAKAAAESRMLREIIPAHFDLDALQTLRMPLPRPEELNQSAEAQGWRVGDDASVRLVILPWTSHQGYSGDISGLIGILPNGQITAVRVTEHRETPGLGDAIDRRKSDWILWFTGRTLERPGEEGWFVRKDGAGFDEITGATITPRAVVRAVYAALVYAEAHHDRLFDLR